VALSTAYFTKLTSEGSSLLAFIKVLDTSRSPSCISALFTCFLDVPSIEEGKYNRARGLLRFLSFTDGVWAVAHAARRERGTLSR
jgi:hypothetical protein